MNSHGNYELLIDKINTFIKRYYLNSLLRGLIFLGAGLFSAYIVITLSEYFGNFDSLFRSVLFYGFILLNLGLIGWLVVPPLMAYLKLGKTLTHDQAADIIGKHFNDVNDKLLNTLQLKKQAADDVRHQELIQASIDQKIENLRPIRFPSAINLRENRRYLKWVLAPAGIIIVLAFAAPSMLTESTKRLIRHDEYFAPIAPFKFVVLNRTLSVVQGDDLNLELKLEGDQFPADVYIEMGNNTFKLDKENVSRFKYQFNNVQENTKFRLSGNGFNSVPYEIKVNPRPSLLHFDVVLNYPAYLRKAPETLSNAGDIIVPAGTTVTWKFHTQNATGVAFNIGDKHQMLQPSEANLFSHSARILNNTIYKLSPVNRIVTTTDSAAYRINAIADEAPAIDVIERPDSVSMQAFYFTGKIQDDHGFSALTFHYKISPAGGDKASEKSFVKTVKADLGINISDFFYFWNLKDLGIKPGDQVTYFFEVADNDGVNGPKKVQSPERSINVPDARELEEQLNSATEQVRKNIQQAAKLAAEIERESQKMNELLLSKNSISFDEQKQLDALLEKRRELDNLVRQIQADNRKNMYNRRENQQQNQQLTEEQKQVEKLLDDVLDPKTRELLDKLQELARNNQKQSTRDQLQKMQMDNRSLKREFGRLEELYKKMAFDQKVNQNINKLNQLAEKQEKLAEETKKPVDAEAAKNEQNKDQKSAQEAMKQAAEQLKKALQEAQKQTGELQKNQQQAQQNQDEQKNKAQQDAQKQALEQLKKALQEAKKQTAEVQKNQQTAQQNQNEQKNAGQQSKAQQDAQKQLAEELKKAIQEAQKQAEEVQKQTQHSQQQQGQNQKAQQDAQKQATEQLKKEIQDAQKLAEEMQKNSEQQQGQQNQSDQKGGEQQQGDQQNAEQQKSAQEQKQQEKLNEEFKDIKKSLEDLTKEAEKIQSRKDFENPKSEQESIEDKMEQSKQQLSKNNRPKASQSQQDAAKQMKQMAQKMQQQQQEEEEEENSVNMKQLRELLKSLVNSSFRQEKTMEALKITSTLDPNYVTLAQTQKTIKDNLKTAEDSLYAISKRVPQIEATVNREISAINERIDQALENLGERRTAEANRHQQYAMTAMNNLALMLSDALNNMQAKMNEQKSGSSSKQSRSQQMQQLSKQQQQLNQNMQRAREQMQREQQQQQQQGQQQNRNQSQQQQRAMSEQLARMAREQQMIRQEMQRLSNEDRRDGGTGIKDMDKISQQMEQTENDIVNRRITEEALRRQQQIHIRMLEAEKAAQEQEQEQQREGHAGKDMPPGYIKALQDYQQVKEKQTEQIRTVPPALNLYYKKKIKTYFDQLNIN